jgi:hypothetical protein
MIIPAGAGCNWLEEGVGWAESCESHHEKYGKRLGLGALHGANSFLSVAVSINPHIVGVAGRGIHADKCLYLSKNFARMTAIW